MTVPVEAPRYYMVIAILALLWNLMGVASYLHDVTMSLESIRSLPPEQAKLYLDMPAWAKGAYAVAVHAGLAGAIGLLLRRKWAIWLFALSLAAILIQFAYPFLMTDALDVMGPSMAIFPAVILLIGVAELWYARRMAARGVLR